MTILTLGENADKLNLLKREKRALGEEIKAVDAQIMPLEALIREQLENIGLKKFSTTAVAITMTEAFIPEVENWEEFYHQ